MDIEREKCSEIYCECCGYPPDSDDDDDDTPPQKEMTWNRFVMACLYIANTYALQNFGMQEGSLNPQQLEKLLEKLNSLNAIYDDDENEDMGVTWDEESEKDSDAGDMNEFEDGEDAQNRIA